MRNRVKKILILGMVIIISFFISCNFSMAYEADIVYKIINDNTNLPLEQRAILELEQAFLNRGYRVRYHSYKKTFKLAPEQATSQHFTYLVCSAFPFDVYYQAFGIEIPYITAYMLDYGEQFNGTNPDGYDKDVLYFHKKTAEESADSNFTRGLTVKDLIDLGLEPGDILIYTGHAMMVQKVEGNKLYLIHSAMQGRDTKSIKADGGVILMTNKNTGKEVGTVNNFVLDADDASSLNTSTMKHINKQDRFAVIRPLLKKNGNYTGKYYKLSYSKKNNKNVITRELADYIVTDTTQRRLENIGIDIDKTVDVFYGSVVNLEQEITYSIKITNPTSNFTYEKMNIKEEISDLVEYVDGSASNGGNISGNIVSWNLLPLEPGETVTLTYKVKVKNKKANFGKKIISKGSVNGIESATIPNVIGYSGDNTTKINDAINKNKDSSDTGLTWVNNIYKDAYGIDLDLINFKMDEVVKNVNDSYIYTSDLVLNMELLDSKYKDMVLPGYYHTLYNRTSNGKYYIPYYERYDKNGIRFEHVDTMYVGNLKAGDILIYLNIQDYLVELNKTTNEETVYRNEDGYYAFVYDGTNFVGRNPDAITTGDRNVFSTELYNLETLYGKDVFVVLRPSLKHKTEMGFVDTELPDGGQELPEEEDSTPLPEDNPDTGLGISLIAIIVVLIVGVCITAYNRRKIYKL